MALYRFRFRFFFFFFLLKHFFPIYCCTPERLHEKKRKKKKERERENEREKGDWETGKLGNSETSSTDQTILSNNISRFPLYFVQLGYPENSILARPHGIELCYDPKNYIMGGSSLKLTRIALPLALASGRGMCPALFGAGGRSIFV